MMKISKKIKIFILVVLVVIFNIALRVSTKIIHEKSTEKHEQYRINQQKIDGHLKHDSFDSYRVKNALMDFSDEEASMIIDAFGLTIPENETDIVFRLFLNSQNDSSGLYKYCLELDGIKDREALYNANSEQRKKGLSTGIFCLKTDEKGNYPYYFTFVVKYKSDFGNVADDDYVKTIESLYELLMRTHY